MVNLISTVVEKLQHIKTWYAGTDHVGLRDEIDSILSLLPEHAEKHYFIVYKWRNEGLSDIWNASYAVHDGPLSKWVISSFKEAATWKIVSVIEIDGKAAAELHKALEAEYGD